MRQDDTIFAPEETVRTRARVVGKTPTNQLVNDAYEKGLHDGQNKLSKSATTKAELTGKEKGKEELAKEDSKKEETTKKTLQTLVERDDIILLKIHSLFPFDLFPDTLVIDTAKVSVINKSFFMTEHVTTVNFKDIIDVWVETSWFLANITVTYMPKIVDQVGTSMNEPLTEKIRLLKRGEAIKAKNILKGVIFANREGVEISKVSPEEIMGLVQRFGDTKAGI